MADDTQNRGRDADARRPHAPEWDAPGSERHDVGRRRGYDFGDPYDQRNYDSGGFGFGGTSGSAGGFGAGGMGPQTGGYGSQANYGQGYTAHGRDGPGPYDLDPAPRRGRDWRHEQYLSWREAHIRKLDLEYEDYRREHQTKFEEDFGSWRERRAAERNPTAGGAAAEAAKKLND